MVLIISQYIWNSDLVKSYVVIYAHFIIIIILL